jgi:signal transduction histidine kinase
MIAELPASVAALDEQLDEQLRDLLRDLSTIVPYDAAAAWLGRDDRPSRRVALPDGATLPSIDGARHLVFGATAESARVNDLQDTDRSAEGGLRSWLGVPLVLHGRRRGWIELFGARPNAFSEGDLRRAEVVVRHAAHGLTQLEAALHLRNELRVHRRLTAAIEAALLAPNLRATFETLLQRIAAGEHVASATLILPVELSYGLGLEPALDGAAELESRVGDVRLVSAVARWTAEAHESSGAMPDDADGSEALLPLTHESETLGWVALRYDAGHTLGAIDPVVFQPVVAILSALLIWLREQARREQQAQQSVRMLVQQSRQARSGAIADLIAGLAHEINNPVSAITGMVELLRRDPDVPEQAHEDLAAIAGEAQRISGLVSRLAGFGAQAGSGQAALLLNEVVADTVATLDALARQRGATLRLALPHESPVVFGNRAQIQQACLDLISNALDAVEAVDEPLVIVEAAAVEGWALVHVRDNGCGVPTDLRDRIFTPGFTTKATGGTRRGLGMGLPMALDIARSHRGTIAVESEIWQGSTFTLRLPLL